MQEFRCPLCKKQYLDNNPPRLLTMCGHTYCQSCLKTMIKRKDYKFQIRCPQDKHKLVLDSATPLQFPRNMVLIETINKAKPKIEASEDINEFLPNNGQTLLQFFRMSSGSNRNSAFTSKRSSAEEGVCLLHQKPLDIICLKQKISICAQCALFGLHKGHSFTTIKDIQTKRNQWISQISGIMEQKKQLDQQTTQEYLQKEICQIVNKKKSDKLSKVEGYFTKIRTLLDDNQQKLKKQIEQEYKSIGNRCAEKTKQKSKENQRFKQWQNCILEAIGHLESLDVKKSINIFEQLLLQQQNNFISQGKELISKINHQTCILKQQLQKALKGSSIQISPELQKQIKKLVTIQCAEPVYEQINIIPVILAAPSPKVNLSMSTYLPSFTQQGQNSQVSLLDLTDDFGQDLNCSYSYSTNVIPSGPINRSPVRQQTETSEIVSSVGQSEIHQRGFMKAKTNTLTANKSLVNLNDHRMYMSPKFKRKPEFLSKGTLPSSLSPGPTKDRLKKTMFKVKDPQRFDKLLKTLEADSSQNLDFTALQLGNEIVKDLGSKLKKCKKVRNVRLMKNSLTDDCLPSILDCLHSVDILNLAQNSFSIKLLDHLLQFTKNSPLSKQKSLQLGQNNINARKCKEKIQELKQRGITITL